MFINYFSEIYVMINVVMNVMIYGMNNVFRFGLFVMFVMFNNKLFKLIGMYSKNEK